MSSDNCTYDLLRYDEGLCHDIPVYKAECVGREMDEVRGFKFCPYCGKPIKRKKKKEMYKPKKKYEWERN